MNLLHGRELKEEEDRLSIFKNDIANMFGHNLFYKKVLIRVFHYLLEKRINTRIFIFDEYVSSIPDLGNYRCPSVVTLTFIVYHSKQYPGFRQQSATDQYNH